jgi:MoaA/NifB/PqqE/SkfB family radical SAM enzyme
MSTIQLSFDRQLARTVRFTERLKNRPVSSSALSRVFKGLDYVARGVFHVWRNHRYITFLKLANMAMVNVQFRLKTERVLGRPYKMKIESTNICNTQCQLCPTGLGYEGRPKGKMKLKEYKKLIGGLGKYLYALDLSMWGDPMIVPEIYEMIRYAHDRRVWTYVSSNLHAFKPGKGQAEALVKSGLDMLTCSLHGATQETYAIYQPGKNFQEAVEKVRHIIETRRRLKSRTPVVQLNFVVTRHNEHERGAFEALAKELGCKAVFSTASMNVRFLGQGKGMQSLGLSRDLLEKKTREHLNEWLPKDSSFVLKPYQQMLQGEFRDQEYNGKKMFDCSWPWLMSVINWDGTVCTCCGSFDSHEDMGNALQSPFGKIWNGEKYRLARRSFRRKLTDEQGKDNPCATCPGFMV